MMAGTKGKMPKALKWLIVLVGGIPASILARIIWESSLCDRWRGENPLTKTLNWLTIDTKASRLFLLSLVMWASVSLLYIFFQFRRITIHAATYDSPTVHKDITEFLRKKIEQNGIRGIQVDNELLGGDPEKGQPKILTVDYSVWGQRRKKQKREREYFKFNSHDT